MIKTNTTVASKKDTSTLVRAVFGPGMLLQHEDLEQLNVYTRDLSRLLFRSFFGCGVVCGLVVSVDGECGKVFVTVRSGLALDCSGDPIYVPKDEHFAIDEDCSLDLKGGSLWVLLCRSRKCCAPRTSMCTCDDDGATSECTRERDCFEIRVSRTLPECMCGCLKGRKLTTSHCDCVNPEDPCYVDHYAGECGCKCEDGSSCDCDCVVLAQLTQQPNDSKNPWKVDHSVRRFIRPVLMRDPLVKEENKPANTEKRRLRKQNKR